MVWNKNEQSYIIIMVKTQIQFVDVLNQFLTDKKPQTIELPSMDRPPKKYHSQGTDKIYQLYQFTIMPGQNYDLFVGLLHVTNILLS